MTEADTNGVVHVQLTGSGIRCTLLVLAVLSALTACRGPDGDGAAPQAGSSADAVAQQMVEGMREGPTEPDDPLWYDPLQEMACSDENLLASRGQPVPRAGAVLCEAALTGDEALWARGEEALAAAGEPVNCWERETVAALQRLLQGHRQHPDAILRFESPPGTACPLVLESLASPLAPDAAGPHVPVSACGGAPVFLHGNIEAMPEGTVRAVTVGSARAEVRSGNGGLFFRAPRSEGPGLARVTVTDSAWPVAGEAHLLYERPEAPCPTPSSAADASPTGS